MDRKKNTLLSGLRKYTKAVQRILEERAVLDRLAELEKIIEIQKLKNDIAKNRNTPQPTKTDTATTVKPVLPNVTPVKPNIQPDTDTVTPIRQNTVTPVKPVKALDNNKQFESDPELRGAIEGIASGGSLSLLDAIQKNEESKTQIYSEVQQSLTSRQQIGDFDAGTYGKEILELEAQKEQVIDQYNRDVENALKRPQTSASLQEELQTLQAIRDGKIKPIDTQLQIVQRQKLNFDNMMEQLTLPEHRFEAYLSNVTDKSDIYVAKTSKLSDLKIQLDEYLKKGDTFVKEDIEAKLKISKDIMSTKTEIDKINRDKRRLFNWIELNSKNRIPNIYELPKDLQSVATSLFTVNGKLMFNDEEFKKGAEIAGVFLPDEFDDLAKAIKPQADNIDVSEEELNEALLDNYADMFAQGAISIGNNLLLVDKTNIYSGEQSVNLPRLERSNKMLEEAIHQKKLYDRVMANQSTAGIGFKNFVESAAEYFVHDAKNTFFFDLPNLENAFSIRSAKKEAQRVGLDNLDNSTKALLYADYVNGLYDMLYDPNKSQSYKNSMIAMQSLKFMAEFIATAGWQKAISSAVVGNMGKTQMLRGFVDAGKHGTKTSSALWSKAAEYGLAESAAVDGVAKYGADVAKYYTAYAAKTVAADALYAFTLENTLGLPKTVLDALLISNGGTQATRDKFGNITVTNADFSDSLLHALSVSERRNFGENVSEMMGNWSLVGKSTSLLKRGASAVANTKLGKITHMPSVVEMLSDISEANKHLFGITTGHSTDAIRRKILRDAASVMNGGSSKVLSRLGLYGPFKYLPRFTAGFNANVLKAGQFHGFFGETLEEYYGILLNHAMMVPEKDMSIWEDMKDSTKDIIGGIGVSTALLGAIGMGSSIVSQVRFNRDLSALYKGLDKNVADEIVRSTLFASTPTLDMIENELIRKFGDLSLLSKPKTLEELEDSPYYRKHDLIRRFIQSVRNYRGAAYGELMVNEIIDKDYRDLVINARKKGYDVSDYLMADVYDRIASIKKKEADNIFGDVDKYIEDNGGVEAIGEIREKILSGELDYAKLPYSQQKALRALFDYIYAKNYYESHKEGVNDTFEMMAERYSSAVLGATNTQHGGVRLIQRKRKDENGNDVLNEKGDPVYETYYWISGALRSKGDGTLSVDTGFDEDGDSTDSYTKEDGDTVLIQDDGGRYANVYRSELEGFEFVEHSGMLRLIDAQTIYEYRKQKFLEELYKRRDNQRSQFGEDISSGSYVTVPILEGGKTVNKRFTILKFTPEGVIYSLSDEDGSNASVYKALDVRSLNALIEKAQSSLIRNVTDLFDQDVDDIVKAMIARDQATAKRLRERKARDDYYNRDDLDLDDDELEERNASNAEAERRLHQRAESIPEESESPAPAPTVIPAEPVLPAPTEDGTPEPQPEPAPLEPAPINIGPTEDVEPEPLPEAKQEPEPELLPQLPQPTEKDFEYKRLYDKIELLTDEVRSFVPDDYETTLQYCETTKGILDDIRSGINDYKMNYEDIDGGRSLELRMTEIYTKLAEFEELLKTFLGANSTEADQDKTFENLVEKCKDLQKHKKATTSTHYFIETGGREWLFRRTHTEMPDRRDLTKDAKEKEKLFLSILAELKATPRENINTFILNKIAQAYAPLKEGKAANIDKYNDFVREALISVKGDEFENKYLDYLNDHEDEEDEVLFGIAQSLVNALTKDNYHSIINGNIHDTIGRVVLDSSVDINNIPKWGNDKYTIRLFGKVVNFTQDESIITQDAFNEIVKKFLEVRKFYENVLGWKLCTEPCLVYGEFEVSKLNSRTASVNKVRIAGETDCIAIDKDGNEHLIDIKTYNIAHKTYHRTNSMLSLDEFYMPITIKESKNQAWLDEDGNPVSMYSQAAQYAIQLAMYNLMRQNHPELNNGSFASREVLIFGTSYSLEGHKISIKKGNVDHGKYLIDIDRSYVQYTDQLKQLMQANNIDQIPNRHILDENAYSAKDDDVLKWINNTTNRVKAITENEQSKQFGFLMSEINRYSELLEEGIAKGVVSDVERGFVATTTSLDKNTDLNTILNYRKTVRQKYVELQSAIDAYDTDRAAEYALHKYYHQDSKFRQSVKDIFDYAYAEFVKLADRLTTDDGTIIDTNDVLLMYDIKQSLVQLARIVLYAEYTDDAITNTVNYAKAKAAINKFQEFFDSQHVDINILDSAKDVKFDYVDNTKGSLQYTQLQDTAGGEKSVSLSVAVNDKRKKLSFVMTDPDFLDPDVTQFYFLKPTDDTDFYDIVVVHKGVEYTPIACNYAHVEDNSRSPLTESANQLKAKIKEYFENNPGETRMKISNRSISRTNGKFINSDKTHPVDLEKLIGPQINVYNVELSRDQSLFGVTAFGANGVGVYVPTTSTENELKLSDSNALYVYSSKNQDTNPSPGFVVLMCDTGYKERRLRGESSRVPVNIITEKFSDGDAKFVLDLLLGKYSSDVTKGLTSRFKISGVESEFSVQDILNMFISYENFNKVGKKEHVHLSMNGNKVRIIGMVEGIEEPVNEEFDLNDDVKRNAFVSYLLEHIRLQITVSFMLSKFNDHTTTGSPIDVMKIKDLLDKLKKDKIRFGSSKLSFDRDDVDKNISGLGWYIKQGFLTTNIERDVTKNMSGLDRPLLSIDESTAIVDSQSGPRASVPVGSRLDEDTDFSLYSTIYGPLGIRAIVTGRTIDQHEIDEISKIAGNVKIPGLIDNFMDVLTDHWIAGSCYLDAITLSKYAPKGTGYHEAFHRVLELLVPDKIRDIAYNRYRKKIGYNAPDIEIAEYAAGEFKRYKLNKPTWKGFRGVFDYVKEYIKLFKDIGSTRLMLLYTLADMGVFSKNKISEARKQRFLSFAKDGRLNEEIFQQAGVPLHFIENQTIFNAIVSSVVRIALHPQTYGNRIDEFGEISTADSEGKYIPSFLKDLDINPTQIITSPVMKHMFTSPDITPIAQKRLAEFLGMIDKSGQMIPYKTVAKELRAGNNKILNGNLKKFMPIVINSVKSQKVAVNDKHKREETDSGEAEEQKDWQWMAGKELSIQDTATARAKFFFSCVPAMEETPVWNVRNGQGMLNVTNVQKLNAAGLYDFEDFQVIWALMLKTMQGCSSVVEFVKRLQNLRRSNAKYDVLYKRVINLARRSFEVDPNDKSDFNWCHEVDETLVPNEVKKSGHNAFGQFTELVSLLGATELIPGVAQNLKGEDQLGAIKIEEADYNHMIREIKNEFTNNILSGETLFVGMDNKGKPYIKQTEDDSIVLTAITVNEIVRKFANVTRKTDISSKPIERELTLRVPVYEDGKPTGKFTTIKETFDRIQFTAEVGNDVVEVPVYIEGIKLLFVDCLNKFGVDITLEELNHGIMLRYGNNTLDGTVKFFEKEWEKIMFQIDPNSDNLVGQVASIASNEAGKTSNNKTSSLVYAMLRIGLYNNGNTDEEKEHKLNYLRNVFKCDYTNDTANVTIIDTLAQMKFEYMRDTQELMFLTILGKKVYAIHKPNRITDVVEQLDKDSEFVKNLCKCPFVCGLKKDGDSYIVDESAMASEVIREVRNGKKFKFMTIPGYKTDNTGSAGKEYLLLSDQEDIALKYGLLGNDKLVLGTLSDKTTWGILHANGFRLLGMNWASKYDINEYNSTFANYYSFDKPLFFTDEQLKYFIRIAKAEYKSARNALHRLRKMKDHEKVDHADGFTPKGHKGVTIAQSARMSTFCGIHEGDEFISFNKLYKDDGKTPITEEELLDIADRKFFSKSQEEQMKIMDRELRIQVQNDLDYLVEKGMISSYVSGGKTVYKNINLDEFKIRKLAGYMYGMTDKEMVRVNRSLLETEDLQTRAIIAYVADMTIKGQQSLQEFLRLFSGEIGFYSYEYDEDGFLKDMTTDFFKRMGGLVSDGERNVRDVGGSNDVVCASFKDELFDKTGQHTEFIKEFEKNAYKGQYSEIYKEYVRKFGLLNAKTNDELDKMSDSDLLTLVEETIKECGERQGLSKDSAKKTALFTISSINARIKKQIDGLLETNVTDGVTIITDEFAERLLRKIGHWTNDVKNAFETLRNASKEGSKYTNKDLLELTEAYNLIRCKLIGAQKYTAFGFRTYDETGRFRTEHGDIEYTPCIDENGVPYTRLVPYYIKTAYMPVFECMASGYTKALLYKMREQHIDMLFAESSAKEGNQGAVDCNQLTFEQWSTDEQSFKDFKFNTYVHSINDLRKQFNTDPHEVEDMALGSQYGKVIMSALTIGEVYDIDGNEMSGEQIRDEIMDAINNYGAAVEEQFRLKYFYKDANHKWRLNELAFMHALQSQLDSRDASDELLQYLKLQEVVEADENGRPVKRQKLIIPLQTMGPTNWVQSVIASVINKDMIDIKGPGQAFYQRSAWGMEGKQRVKWLCEDDNPIEINHGAPLKIKNEEGSMDVVLTIDFFEYLLPELLKHQSFAEIKQWLITKGIISGFSGKYSHQHNKVIYDFQKRKVEEGNVYMLEDGTIIDTNTKEGKTHIGEDVTATIWKNATSNMIGYRIPTQAVSSIHAMRCVDVLPAINHTVVFPKEITAITGSDFDIDKFFISTLYYKSHQNENLVNRINEQLDEIRKKYPGLGDKTEYHAYDNQVRKVYNDLKSRILLVRGKVKFENPKEKDESDQAYDERIMSMVNTELESAENKEWYDKEKYEYLRSSIRSLDMLWKESELRSDVFDEVTEKKQYSYNKLLKWQIRLRCMEGTNIAQMHGPIDADTVPLKDIAKKLGYKKKEYSAFTATSLRVHIESKMAFAIGKFGIGPYALNNNNHVLTYLYGVEFVKDPNQLLTVLGLNSLHEKLDRYGCPILSYISGLINAHVDVAKDPYIRALGVNGYTYNLVALLIRTGYGKDTFWFTTQPIMKELYKQYDKSQSIYGLSQEEEQMSQYSRTKRQLKTFFATRASQLLGTSAGITEKENESQVVDKINKYFKAKNITLNNLIKQLMCDTSDTSLMERIACGELHKDDDVVFKAESLRKGDTVDITYAEMQCAILAANFQLLENAQSLSNLVQYTKIDTKKQGKTISELMHYAKQFEKLYASEGKVFINVLKMIDKSFIGPKTKGDAGLGTVGVINIQTEVLRENLYEATDGYKSLVDHFVDLFDIEDPSTDIRTKITKMINNKLMLDYFLKGSDSYCALRDIDPIHLFVGHNSIRESLSKIKAAIASKNPKYRGLKENVLIGKLVASTVVDLGPEILSVFSKDIAKDYNIKDIWRNAQFVKLNTVIADSVKSSDLLNAWRQLLNHPNQTVRRFGERLIVYAALTNGLFGGNTDLFKYVPFSWSVGDVAGLRYSKEYENGKNTYVQYVKNTIDKLNSPSFDAETLFTQQEEQEMITSRSFDNDIVPIVSEDRFNADTSIISSIHIGERVIHCPLFFAAVENTFDKTTMYRSPKYIRKLIDAPLFGVHRYAIYKRVSWGFYEDEEGEKKLYPIYVLAPNPSAKYVGGHTISGVDMSEYNSAIEQHCNIMSLLLHDLEAFTTNSPAFKYISGDSEFVHKVLSEALQNDNISTAELLFVVLKDRIGKITNAGKDRSPFWRVMLDSRAHDASQNGGQIVSKHTIPEYDKGSNVRTENTNLDFDQIDDSYTKVDEFDNSIQKAFGEFIKGIETLNNSDWYNSGNNHGDFFHVEYYKKRVVGENGKTYYRPTITVSLTGMKHHGAFEISAQYDESTGEYTNTYYLDTKLASPKRTHGNKYANTPMTDEEIQDVYKSILYSLLDGQRLTATELSSKFAIGLLKKARQYNSKYGIVDNSSDIYILEKDSRYSGQLVGVVDKDGVIVAYKANVLNGEFELGMDIEQYIKGAVREISNSPEVMLDFAMLVEKGKYDSMLQKISNIMADPIMNAQVIFAFQSTGLFKGLLNDVIIELVNRQMVILGQLAEKETGCNK